MSFDLPLAEQNVAILKKGTQPLDLPKVLELLELLPEWRMDKGMDINQLVRIFEFADFTDALQFANAVNAMADEANHHPVHELKENLLTMRWWTHSIKGLHLNDFIMAARCDELYQLN